MKKILLSAYACSPLRGSEEINGWSWATGLAKLGYQVWCLTNIQDAKQLELTRQKLTLDNLHFICIELPHNLDDILFKPSSKKIYFHYYLWRKKAKKIAQKLHNRHNYQVAHHVTYGSFQQGSCIYNLKNCKIIFGPVGGGQMALPIFEPYFKNAWRTERLRKQISKWLFRFHNDFIETIKSSDHILTINQETENLLKSSPFYKKGQNAMVSDTATPVAYENLKFIDKKPDEVLKILWLGRLIPRKGVNLSLKAISYLPKDMQYQLIIVGGGEQHKYIDKWVNEYNLDASKILQKGQIPFAQVSEQYKNADVMLFCSLRDTAGNQVLEAMAHSLPVIVLNISGMVQMVPPNCGIKINPTSTLGTAKDIAVAIQKMQNYNYRIKLARNAFDHAMITTWKNKIQMVTSKFY